MGYTLDFNRVLSDRGMQTAGGVPTPTFEGGGGDKISTDAFGILNQDEMMIWQVG
jgi:hypothetical protein